MTDNVVSMHGNSVKIVDPAREDFLAFMTRCYDTFQTATGEPATGFTVTMMTDTGVFDSFWSATRSTLPVTAVLGFALTSLTTEVAVQKLDYTKPKD